MSPAAPLRRSTRCRRPTYNVGDVVEITHGSTAGGVSIGKLVSRLSEDEQARESSKDPLWLVSFHGRGRGCKDEVISEKWLQRVITPASKAAMLNEMGIGDEDVEEDDDEDVVVASSSKREGLHSSSPDSTHLPSRRSRSDRTRGNGSHHTTSSGSSNDFTTDDDVVHRKRKRSATKRYEATPRDPITESRRKARSGRMRAAKAAKLEKAALGRDHASQKNSSTRTRSSNKRKVNSGKSTIKNDTSSCTKNLDSSEESKEPKIKEEVVKVKYHTGTLFLYRGENPRAVFVRRY